MKVAPLMHELQKHPELFLIQLVHTGQHYDDDMSDIFFEELEIPPPNRFLGIGSGTNTEQTARVMMAFERACIEEKPDLVVVVGDVNSTMACALTAKKLNIMVAHVEAGLRSRDWSMPEEINRVVTDAICDFLFTPSRDADRNLLMEGISKERIHFVGNVMIDCLIRNLAKTENRNTLERFGLEAGHYAILTLHRPSNVDNREVLGGILNVILDLSEKLPIFWPIHPRCRKMMSEFNLLKSIGNTRGLVITDPVGYVDMLTLNRVARMIITDSGGLQEEATFLGVPCITLRYNTERPVTVEAGANRVIGNKPEAIRSAICSILNEERREIQIPEFWDGKASERIVNVLMSLSSEV
jgi:UDP-N-acetylglucosamine 2-epimerase (non-hydrolysing)